MPAFINKRADRLFGDQTIQLLMNKYVATVVFLLTCGTVRQGRRNHSFQCKQTASCSLVIQAVNNYALPKNCIVNGFSLRLTKCWLENHFPLLGIIAFHCIGLIF